MKLTVYRQTISKHVDDYKQGMTDGRPYTLSIGRWYKPKTTGKDSQCNHIWGHAAQIGAHVGETDRAIVDQAIKDAVTKGYTRRRNWKGVVVPVGLSAANTKDAAAVIEQLHEYADFIPLKLIEGEE